MTRTLQFLGAFAFTFSCGCSGSWASREEATSQPPRPIATSPKSGDTAPSPARIPTIKHATGGSRGKNGK